jgi:hypothetical protein
MVVLAAWPARAGSPQVASKITLHQTNQDFRIFRKV